MPGARWSCRSLGRPGGVRTAAPLGSGRGSLHQSPPDAVGSVRAWPPSRPGKRWRRIPPPRVVYSIELPRVREDFEEFLRPLSCIRTCTPQRDAPLPFVRAPILPRISRSSTISLPPRCVSVDSGASTAVPRSCRPAAIEVAFGLPLLGLGGTLFGITKAALRAELRKLRWSSGWNSWKRSGTALLPSTNGSPSR